MDFLICYEHVVREVENDTLIKHELEKRGYSCKIVHYNDVDYLLHAGKEKAKVVVTPWLRHDGDLCDYLPFAKKPYKLVNLQWEQVYSKRGLEIGLTSTSGEALNAYHMCWGENSRNRLIEYGVPEDHVVVVGAIQMDYGRPLFKNYYLPKERIAEEYGLDANKKWNLLVSSFAYATRHYDDSNNSAMNVAMANTVAMHKQSQQLTLEWIENLLRVSDCEFIYRPHPSEKMNEILNSMAQKYPNFHIISERSVKQWAKVCDKVNLWISTSNAELLSMGVDFSLIRPVEIPLDREVESMYNETFITDCDSFVRFNTTYIKPDPDTITEKLKRINHFYSYDPDYPAYKRTADYLEQILKSSNGLHFHLTAKQQLKKSITSLKRGIMSVLTRKCYLRDSMEPVKNLPLKPVVKQRMEIAVNKHKSKDKAEQAMQAYLKQYDNETSKELPL